MSRCFPFPPPGYEKKTRSDHIDLLAEEKHKEKKHKKEKRDKERREGKEKKDKDRSKDKRKEKKDRKEKHKDKKKKNKDKDKSSVPYERADKQTESPHGDMLGECSRKTEEIKHSKFTVELGRRIKDEEKVAADRPVQNSISNLGASAALVKERVSGDKIISPTMGALQRQIDGLERPADKFTISTQRKNDGLVSANAVQKERSTSDKLVPELTSTGQRGNGSAASPMENPVGSLQRSERPYPASSMEVHNYKSNKVASNSNNAVSRPINGMVRPAQSFSAPKNVDNTSLAVKVENRGEANKTAPPPNHIVKEQRKIDGTGRSVEKDADNTLEEGKAKNKEREVNDRKEERCRDREHDQKKIKDKDKHKGKEKEKTKVKKKSEPKHKEEKEPGDGKRNEQLDSINLKPLAPRTDNAASYIIDENIKKRKESDTNSFANANNLRPNKFPRTNPSSHLCEENGRRLESSHITTTSPVTPEAINNMQAGKPVDNEEHMINGITRVQPSSVGLRHPVAAETVATVKVCRKPHPDSVYFNQIYSIPKVDAWLEHDDQEWLFSSCHLQKPKPELEGNEVPKVWSEALRIESEDVVALPYVIPF